jgi:Holliday junction resolvase YEN1
VYAKSDDERKVYDLQAPGEAEAELAYLNRMGVIDAVLSDDVDNFLFGATMVIRK